MRTRGGQLRATMTALAVAGAVTACAATTTSSPGAPGAPGTAGGTAPASGLPSTTAAGAPGGTIPLPATGPVPFTTVTITVVDRTRPTAAGAGTPAAPATAPPARPERTIRTVVRIPTDGAPAPTDADGPRALAPVPLIVFSHGLGGSPEKFTQLLDAWAAAGFVVAAPTFPLTNDQVPAYNANWNDVAQQPGDVRAVIDDLVRRNDTEGDPLHGRIRTDRIGAGGLSLGGATTYALVYHDCCRDDRVRAAMVLSGGRFPMPAGDYVMDGHVPLLIMHGDHDVAMPYKLAVEAYAALPGPVWFATLDDGTHAPPFEDTPSRFDELSVATTTDFWRGTLGGDEAALARVPADAAVPGLATVQSK